MCTSFAVVDIRFVFAFRSSPCRGKFRDFVLLPWRAGFLRASGPVERFRDCWGMLVRLVIFRLVHVRSDFWFGGSGGLARLPVSDFRFGGSGELARLPVSERGTPAGTWGTSSC